MGEQRAAVDVADRIEPFRAGDPELVVDVEIAAGLDARLLEADVVGAGPTPDGNQELVAAQLLAALEPERHLSTLAA